MIDSPRPSNIIRCLPEVADALRAGRPVVALESSVLAQGLPIPANADAARRMVDAVRGAGAVPAITAVVRGAPVAGLERPDLERFLRREGVGKVSARDLPFAMARGEDGATTVAATLVLARLAGLRVFATGGIGGVHREPAFDESADLVELAQSPVVVVCAGAKSILDLRATLERLETLGVPVVGYRTSELPGFFTASTGIALDQRAESAAEIAAIFRAHLRVGGRSALVVMQPPPAEWALDPDVIERATSAALAEARSERVRGAAVTPYLLARVERATGGRSVSTNLALLERNAELAAAVANALSESEGADGIRR